MKILGIETSCDETAASIIEVNPKNDKIKVISNVVSSQIKIHQQYGGVVPEVAARNHIKNILPVIEQTVRPLSLWERGRGEGVDAIAVTRGPGLIPALIIGIETAKSLAYAWNKPIIGVNHMAGHIYSNWLENDNPPKFPALALVVSGGHTELVLMKGHFKFKLLGQTRDDAVGEAFDKVAKILGLGYPGGPIVSKMAGKDVALQRLIKMPRPMINDKNFEFSFSGLKTSVLYQIQKDKNYKKRIPDYCASFQQAVVDVLIKKTILAAKQYKVRSVMLAGGVAANLELRKQLGEAVKENLPQTSYHAPDLKYTTDNATMIAVAGYFFARHSFSEGGMNKYKKNINTDWSKIKVDCNLSL